LKNVDVECACCGWKATGEQLVRPVSSPSSPSGDYSSPESDYSSGKEAGNYSENNAGDYK